MDRGFGSIRINIKQPISIGINKYHGFCKWAEKAEGSGDRIYSLLCGNYKKENYRSIVTWSGTDIDNITNLFTWSKEENDWVVPGNH